jgi:hypothetical protein
VSHIALPAMEESIGVRLTVQGKKDRKLEAFMSRPKT